MEDALFNQICELFFKRTGIDFKNKTEYWDKPLLGVEININPRELLQIYMDMKYSLGIKLEEDGLIEKRFMTFDSILKYAGELVNIKQEVK